MATHVVILAAGQGKRMVSHRPKVLHLLAGKPILEHVIETAWQITKDHPPVVVYGHHGDLIREHLAHLQVYWIEQKKQLGTGHALMQALPVFKNEDRILVLCGDAPLISSMTLQKLMVASPPEALGMVTASVKNPSGYGRILRQNQQIIGIVEEKDATTAERTITEINPSIYYVAASQLKRWLPQLNNKNSQAEYYLTDMVALSVQENVPIISILAANEDEILGINDRVQLAHLERIYQRQQVKHWMYQGVTFADPERFDSRGDVRIGQDVTIDINVILEGKVVIGNHCEIGPHSILRNTQLGDHVVIKSHSILDGAQVGNDCVIGPFARLRPGTRLEQAVHVGNFVEIKNSEINDKSKINHLSYIGDCKMGKQVNVGAGTITCNYDGAFKHQTTIEDGVHIGSDTQLIAPVKVGKGATIGAGSTISKDVAPHELTITHQLKQRTLKTWSRPQKKQ